MRTLIRLRSRTLTVDQATSAIFVSILNPHEATFLIKKDAKDVTRVGSAIPRTGNKLLSEEEHSAAAADVFFAVTSLTINLVLPFLLQLSQSKHHEKDVLKDIKFYRKHKDSVISEKEYRLLQVWTASTILFVSINYCLAMAENHKPATILIATAGVSWALTVWAPFALVGGQVASRLTYPSRHSGDGESDIGAVTGLHNVVITAPQIIAAIFCYVLLQMLQLWEVHQPFRWILLLASFLSLLAAILLRNLLTDVRGESCAST